MMDLTPRKISSSRVVLTSFLVSVSDVVLNLVVAYISGSIVILSQALEGAADLLASGFLLIGINRSKKPSDRKHPYGYGRELYFWTFLSALATFVITAGASFYFGYQRFREPEAIANIPLVFAMLIFAIITNGYSTSLSLRRLLGKKSLSHIWRVFKDSAFIETKTTFVIDLMGTTAAVLGLISITLYQITSNQRFDGIGAMAIGVTLAILAVFIIEGAKDLLVGRSAPPEVETKIANTALEFSKVKEVLDLRTVYIGPEKLLVNMEVHLQDKLETDEIELLIDKIEAEIKKAVPTASSIQIELETPDV